MAMVLALAVAAGFGSASFLPAQQIVATGAAKPARVDGDRIENADREPGKWMSHGRTYGEQRFSPLQSINDKNITQIGLAWSYDLDTRRGQEATPLVIDGWMYFTTA